jgi:four helix bundle protein
MTRDPGSKRRTPEQFDLVVRTGRFGEAAIRFCRSVPETTITRPLIGQLVRAATSVGANWCEADNAESKKDFRHKAGICLKEARETTHWLQMMATAVPDRKDEMRPLWREARELSLIFAAMIRSSRKAETE